MNIAVISGGPSAEREVALQSAQLVMGHLDADKHEVRLIILESHGWFDQQTGLRVTLDDFSLRLPSGRVYFDFVYLIIHGTPVEDGKLQGYFEHLGIPQSTCSTLAASLTFDKQRCKEYLRAFDIDMAPSVLVTSRDDIAQKVEGLDLPLFIKPNRDGSSFGVSKVRDRAALSAALEEALRYDSEVICEEFIDGTEYTCAVMSHRGGLLAFPLIEIIPDTDFFTYEAKYEGASQEICPARLNEEDTGRCQHLSKRLYQILNCAGVVRFDYIMQDGVFYFLEVNTVPGLSEASLVPQMVREHGWTITYFLEALMAAQTVS